MKQKIKIERRSYSLKKPLLYFLLQVILLWEIFWVLTGEATLTSWSYIEVSFSAIMIAYLAYKSYTIFRRTPKPNSWDDAIKAEKFLNT